ncbi:MAG: penicillin acylase family protein [Caldilineaceae bacterium]|nr:penicillin acylase family protein [Caldilineaceae bacterium]
MTLPTILTILVVLFIAVALFGGIFLYVYWWLIQRALPDLSGKLPLEGLSAPVEILRDERGVPSIYAQNRADLFRAQGFVHAQDRLWQMEQNRRIASGRLSELFGVAALDVDRFSRIVGFWRAAQAELVTLEPEALAVLEQYVGGINAYIASRPGRLAPEFNLLRRQPEPWTPLDVLAFSKVMGWSLSVNWESELVRLQLANQLDPLLAAELEPDYPPRNPAITEALGEKSMRLVSTAGLLLSQYEQLQEWLGPSGSNQGSNNWVVGPKASSSGRAILCNDPHLALTMPSVWYENHLHCNENADGGPQTTDGHSQLTDRNFHVSGVTFAGTPGVTIGHNERIAWGVTNAFPDVQDLYIERPHPEKANHFAFGDGWEEAQVIEETISVRRQNRPHIERVVVTRHGPLINRLVAAKGATVPLALRWQGHEPGRMLHAILGINTAQNWEEFDAALADWSVPAQNFVYADVDGNIGYRLAGDIPIRKAGLGLVPAPGWTDEYEWGGLIPHAELPTVYNPPSGLIVTANNKLTGDDYPYFLGVEYFPGWRARRIEQMLQEKRRLGLKDMEQIQQDTTSLYAAELAPLLAAHQSDDPFVNIGVNLLRNWGYKMERESGAALVFHYALMHLLEMTFGDKLGPAKKGFLGGTLSPLFIISGFMHRAETRLLEILRENEESPWYTDAKTGRQRSRDELIGEALLLSVRRIRKEVNPTPRNWAWGRMHQIRYGHPMGSVRILKSFFNRGPFPLGGDGTTPNQTSYAPELPPGLAQIVASYRQIYDVGAWDTARTITTSGQSGHPLSDNYADQIPMWLEGDYHPMPWTREAVEAIAVHRLRLGPG